jgi:hypothetical protein
MKMPRSIPALIALGGFPGAGRTTQATRLAGELRIPLLNADSLGDLIGVSEALRGLVVNAQWIAYDVVFEDIRRYVTVRCNAKRSAR